MNDLQSDLMAELILVMYNFHLVSDEGTCQYNFCKTSLQNLFILIIKSNMLCSKEHALMNTQVFTTIIWLRPNGRL